MDVFRGFRAPELKTLVVHGRGDLEKRDLVGFVGEKVDVTITGKEKKDFVWADSKTWIGQM